MADISTYDKAHDLAESIGLSNSNWSAWELEFIESFAENVLDGKEITWTKKQVEKIDELWERL